LGQSTNKRVIVSRFDREPLQGFVQTPEGFGPGGFDLLSPEGTLLKIPFSDTKAVCFVRDFEPGESWRKHRSFLARPKTAGLWVRLRFRDGDSLEGLAPNNLLSFEASGFSIVPPDPTFHNQRIFVPREALAAVEVLGVIGSPLRRRAKAAVDKEKQIALFE
jgi:hypothetical protein